MKTTLKKVKSGIVFGTVFLFLFSFFAESGPLLLMKNQFVTIYNAIPGDGDTFGVRDILAFIVVYFAWYFFISYFSSFIYFLKEKLLPKLGLME